MKKLCALLIVFVFIFGCDVFNDDDQTNIYQKDENQTVADGDCPAIQLEKIAITIDDGEYLTNYTPRLVAKRIYDLAQEALDHCFGYEEVSDAYREAMKGLNEGQEPATIEFSFKNYMIYVIGYDDIL